MTRKPLLSLGSALLIVALSLSAARADAPAVARSNDPRRIRGLERPGREEGSARRHVATVLFYPFRKFFELQLWLGNKGLELGRKLRILPHPVELFVPPEGEMRVYPSFFFESRHAVLFGARLLARGHNVETRVQAGAGGSHDLFAESEIFVPHGRYWASSLTLGALYDERNDLEMLGVGQDPDSDPRNAFRTNALSHDALYYERRARATVTADELIAPGFSVVPSGSLLSSHVDDAFDARGRGLSHVFQPNEFISKAANIRVLYGEAAVRVFNRKLWAGTAPGTQIEIYGGYGGGVAAPYFRYLAAGGRVVGFIPVIRKSNTLSPKIVIDAVAPISGADLPFTVLPRQGASYRGYDLRCDQISAVASLDYRWAFNRYLAARLFTDFATVAPEIGQIFGHPPRAAAGFGFDVYNAHADLASILFSGSGDGVRLIVKIGQAAPGGDRQHRS